MSLDTFGFSAELLRAVAKEGYRDPITHSAPVLK
jgi:hypothetical protein